LAYYQARKNYSFFWNKIRKINQEEELMRTRRWKRLLSYFLQEVRTKSDLRMTPGTPEHFYWNERFEDPQS
jgi:hypothetical protein